MATTAKETGTAPVNSAEKQGLTPAQQKLLLTLKHTRYLPEQVQQLLEELPPTEVPYLVCSLDNCIYLALVGAEEMDEEDLGYLCRLYTFKFALQNMTVQKED